MAKAHKLEFDGLRLVAGHPALDFVNSVKYRGGAEPGDRVTTYAALVNWAEFAGVIDTSTASEFRRLASLKPGAASSAQTEIIILREAFRSLLPPLVEDEHAIQEAEAILTSVLREVAKYRQIDPASLSLVAKLPVQRPSDLLLWIGLTLEDFMLRDPKHEVGCCDGCDCDWVFLRGTRGPARRWCDSRTCGNAERVRQYRLNQNSGSAKT